MTTGTEFPIIGRDLVEIIFPDGLYQRRSADLKKVEGKSIYDMLTETDPELSGISISQPDKIFRWATTSDRGKLIFAKFLDGRLAFNFTWQIAVNDHVSAENSGTVYIADRKQGVTYWVNLNQRTLTRTQGAKEGYRHTDKLITGYTYIGEISDIINQFTAKGFAIQEG